MAPALLIYGCTRLNVPARVQQVFIHLYAQNRFVAHDSSYQTKLSNLASTRR
jgi:hypothetical protein